MKTMALFLMLAGCGSAASLSMQVKPAGQQVDVPAVLGMKLRAGDEFTLDVATQVPAHVYAFQVPVSGPPRQLFPEDPAADHPVPAGQPLHLPQQGRYLLEGAQGAQQIVVLASTRPIPREALQARLQPEAAGKGGAWTREAQNIPPGQRGVDRGDESQAVQARFAQDGVAVLRFPFRQVP